MSFEYSLSIPFHLVDAAGVLFFGHLFPLAHQAFEQFITQALALSWKEWFDHPEWIVPIKQAEAEYHHPLYAGQLCTICLHIEEIRNHSLSIHYTFYQQGLKCCQAKTVHLFCDRKTRTKKAIPLSLHTRLTSLAKKPL